MTKKKKHKLPWWELNGILGRHGLKWNKQKGPGLKFQNGKWVKNGK